MDYPELIAASKKITGNSEHYLDLLHYSICEFSMKANMQEVLDVGAARFYIIRVMMNQWRSNTGPFYKDFIKRSPDLPYDLREENKAEIIDEDQVECLLSKLDWYDRELFKLYANSDLNYTELSKKTGIPRTSISLTVRRVRQYLKQNIQP